MPLLPFIPPSPYPSLRSVHAALITLLLVSPPTLPAHVCLFAPLPASLTLDSVTFSAAAFLLGLSPLPSSCTHLSPVPVDQPPPYLACRTPPSHETPRPLTATRTGPSAHDALAPAAARRGGRQRAAARTHRRAAPARGAALAL